MAHISETAIVSDLCDLMIGLMQHIYAFIHPCSVQIRSKSLPGRLFEQIAEMLLRNMNQLSHVLDIQLDRKSVV